MLIFIYFFVSLSAKLVPVGYGIKKLQISCVVEDDKVRFGRCDDADVNHNQYDVLPRLCSRPVILKILAPSTT